MTKNVTKAKIHFSEKIESKTKLSVKINPVDPLLVGC